MQVFPPDVAAALERAEWNPLKFAENNTAHPVYVKGACVPSEGCGVVLTDLRRSWTGYLSNEAVALQLSRRLPGVELQVAEALRMVDGALHHSTESAESTECLAGTVVGADVDLEISSKLELAVPGGASSLVLSLVVHAFDVASVTVGDRTAAHAEFLAQHVIPSLLCRLAGSSMMCEYYAMRLYCGRGAHNTAALRERILEDVASVMRIDTVFREAVRQPTLSQPLSTVCKCVMQARAIVGRESDSSPPLVVSPPSSVPAPPPSPSQQPHQKRPREDYCTGSGVHDEPHSQAAKHPDLPIARVPSYVETPEEIARKKLLEAKQRPPSDRTASVSTKGAILEEERKKKIRKALM